MHWTTYLQLNLGLSDILLTATTTGNLLCLCNLVPHGLGMVRAFLSSNVSADALTSALKSSSGYPSTALMLNTELGCTVAKPPDTISPSSLAVTRASTPERPQYRLLSVHHLSRSRTEELLASSLLFNNLHKTRLQLLNRWDVAGEDTHFSRLGGDVDLHAAISSVVMILPFLASHAAKEDLHILGLVDSLRITVSLYPPPDIPQFCLMRSATFQSTLPAQKDIPGEAEPESTGSCRTRHRHIHVGGQAQRGMQKERP